VARNVCFTSCNNAYLDRAAVLARSFKRHHPDWKFVVLLSDWDPALNDVVSAVPAIDEIFPIRQLEQVYAPSWTFKHDAEELCTAVKPFYAAHLLREGVERILFLDPDTVVLRRLDEVEDGLEQHSFLLTPHVWAPNANPRHIELHEISCLAHGIYNLGFFALRSDTGGQEVVDYWADRLRSYCYRDHASGIFTDQKWANFFPVFFDGVHVLKQRTLNISSWNLVNIELVGSVPELYSDGEQVGFVHFSGLNDDVFLRASAEVGQLSNSVVSIFNWYKNAVAKERSFAFPSSKAYLTYLSGRPIRKSHRIHYRLSSAYEDRYPNPYDDSSPDSFYQVEIAPREKQLIERHENPEFIVRRY
jgi:hypothetical protein